MFIAVAPVVFNLDKKLVNSAIMQLELENETRDTNETNKVFNNGNDFTKSYNLSFNYSLSTNFSNYHYFSKKYLTLYFPAVPTPPPNFS